MQLVMGKDDVNLSPRGSSRTGQSRRKGRNFIFANRKVTGKVSVHRKRTSRMRKPDPVEKPTCQETVTTAGKITLGLTVIIVAV